MNLLKYPLKIALYKTGSLFLDFGDWLINLGAMLETYDETAAQ